MPAKRRSRRQKSYIIKKNLPLLRLVLVLPLVILLYLFVLFTRTNIWSKNDITVLVAPRNEGMVFVYVLDPVDSEFYKLIFPENLEVNVYGNLGKWKLGSLWKLGLNEGKPGEVLKGTLVNNFEIPIEGFLGPEFPDLESVGYLNLFKNIFSRYTTNLSKADILHLILFSAATGNKDKIIVDLTDTAFLESSKLEDGVEGFLKNGELSPKVKSHFYSHLMAEGGKKIILRDRTGTYGNSDSVARTVETIGANVAVIAREDIQKNLKCLVIGEDKDFIEKLRIVFDCETKNGKADGSFDVEMIMGKDFFNLPS